MRTEGDTARVRPGAARATAGVPDQSLPTGAASTWGTDP